MEYTPEQVADARTILDRRARAKTAQVEAAKINAGADWSLFSSFGFGNLNPLTTDTDDMGEVERVLKGAVYSLASETSQFVGDSADSLRETLGLDESELAGMLSVGTEQAIGEDGLNIPFTDMKLAWLTQAEWHEAAARHLDATGEKSGQGIPVPDLPAPDTAGGEIAQTLVKFAMGYTAFSRAKAVQGLNSWGKAAAAGFATDLTAFDPYEGRLADFMKELGVGESYTQYMETDLEDGNAESRFKTAIEGLGLGVLTDVAFQTVRAARGFAKSRFTPKDTDVILKDDPVPAADAEPVIPDGPGVSNKEVVDAVQAQIDEKAAKRAEAGEQALAREEQVHVAAERKLRERLKGIDPSSVRQMLARVIDGDLVAVNELTDFYDFIDYDDLYAQGEDLPAAINQIMNTTSHVFDEYIDDAVGGVQTDKVRTSLANMMGMKASNITDLADDVNGGRGLAARMTNAQMMLIHSAGNVRKTAAAASARGATQADELKAYQAIEHHAYMQAHVRGAGSEIARALRSMGQMKRVNLDLETDLDELLGDVGNGNREFRKEALRKMSKIRNVREINKATRTGVWDRVQSWVLESYINGLLSAVSTVMLNNASNTLKVIEGIGERYAMVAIGKGREVINRQFGIEPVERVHLREANAFAMGTLRGARMALNIPLTEIAQAVKRGDWDGVTTAFRPTKVGQIDGKVRGTGTVYRALAKEEPQLDTIQRMDVDTRKAIRMQDDGPSLYAAVKAKDFTDVNVTAKAVNTLGSAIRYPGRLVMASDELFKQIGYQQELAAMAYRKAAKAADDKGLTGEAYKKYVAQQQSVFLSNPEDFKLHEGAIDFARYQTFQTQLAEGGFARGFEQLMNRHPFMRFVVPFFRTPVNIVKQTVVERTPLGLFYGREKALLREITSGGPAADQAMARVAMGSLVMGSAMVWAMDGKITGGGAANGVNRNTEELDGIPKYSVKIGDTWYQYNRLEPLGMLMGLAADMAIATQEWEHGDEGMAEQISEGAKMAVTLMTSNILDKTWFKGISDMAQALDDPKRYAGNYVQNLSITIATPWSSALRRTNVDADPIMREADTWVQAWRRNIPGLSDDLPPSRDILGDIRSKSQYLGSAFTSPVAIGKEPESFVRQELVKLEMDYQMPQRDVFSVGKDLSGADYSRFLELRGEYGGGLEGVLEKIMRSPVWSETGPLSNSGREMLVRMQMEGASRFARQMLLAQNPELREEVTAAQRLVKTDRFN